MLQNSLRNLRRLTLAQSALRRLSVQQHQSQYVKQGGKLSIHLATDSNQSKVTISSKWQESIDVRFDNDLLDVSFSEDVDNNSIVMMSKQKGEAGGELQVTIPEYLDLDIGGYEIDLQLKNKMQGDISISCFGGTIVADKLRGAFLDFECGNADITIKKVLEGNSNIQCRALKAKMINGDTVQVSARNIDVDAIYGAYSRLEAEEDITVGLSRGDMEALSTKGNISVSGIDGSFDIHAERGTVRLQVNKLYPSRQQTVSEEQVGNTEGEENADKERVSRGSYASAPEGHIIAVVDPELAASIYCHSESNGLERMCATVNSDAFILDDVSGPDQSGDVAVRTPRVGTWEGGVIKGYLTGKSTATKRPTSSGGGSGKIDLRGAESQSQNGLTMSDRHVSSDALYASTTDISATEGTTSDDYDLTLTARGNIRVDTMSWIQIIRSKYGFEDSMGGTLPPSAPGRTASSTANAAKILNLTFKD